VQTNISMRIENVINQKEFRAPKPERERILGCERVVGTSHSRSKLHLGIGYIVNLKMT
jgi:hypothetical protein